MKKNMFKSIDIKSLIIGMLIVLLCLSFYGNSKSLLNENIIKTKTLIITDDNGNEVVELSSMDDGGVLKVLNKYGTIIGALGSNQNGNGQFLVLNKNANPMAFMGTTEDNAGLIRTFLTGKRVSTELGKGFLSTYNSKTKRTGYFGTSSDNNGIIKTFDKYGKRSSFTGNASFRIYNHSGQSTCFLGIAANGNGMITLTDPTGKKLFSK